MTPASGSQIRAPWLNKESEECLCSHLALCQTASPLGVAVIDSSLLEQPLFSHCAAQMGSINKENNLKICRVKAQFNVCDPNYISSMLSTTAPVTTTLSCNTVCFLNERTAAYCNKLLCPYLEYIDPSSLLGSKHLIL